MEPDQINKAWSWTGTTSKNIIDTNQFGHILIEAEDGKYWKLCPEKLSVEIIAVNKNDFESLRTEQTFISDWAMADKVQNAKTVAGELNDGETYCLKLPLVLGGLYEDQNFGTILHEQLIALTGEMGLQLKDLPDGAKIEFDA